MVDVDETDEVIAGVVTQDAPGLIRVYTEGRRHGIRESVVPWAPGSGPSTIPPMSVHAYVGISSKALLDAQIAVSRARFGDSIFGAEQLMPGDEVLAAYTSSFSNDLEREHCNIVVRRASGDLVRYTLAWGDRDEQQSDARKAREKKAWMDRVVKEEAMRSLGMAFGKTQLDHKNWKDHWIAGHLLILLSSSVVVNNRMTDAMKSLAMLLGPHLYRDKCLTLWEALPFAIHFAQNASLDRLAELQRSNDEGAKVPPARPQPKGRDGRAAQVAKVFEADMWSLEFGWEKILTPDAGFADLSDGEVRSLEMSIHATKEFHPEGLLSEEIFGPVKCECGELAGRQQLGKHCSQCEKDCCASPERFRRTGHLVLPCDMFPSKRHAVLAGWILGLTLEQLHETIKRQAFLEVERRASHLIVGKVWSEDDTPEDLRAETGSEMIVGLLERIVPVTLFQETITELDDLEAETLPALAPALCRRAVALHAMISSDTHPFELMTRCLPVSPAGFRDARPDGFASDVNKAYFRAINQLNRIRRLTELAAPTVIIGNEEGMLQKAIFDLPKSYLVTEASNMPPGLAREVKSAKAMNDFPNISKRAQDLHASVVWAAVRERGHTDPMEAISESWTTALSLARKEYVDEVGDLNLKLVYWTDLASRDLADMGLTIKE